MIFSYLLWWPVIGMLAILVTVTTHLAIAYSKGYDPMGYWEKHRIGLSDNKSKMALVIGCYIWPIRLMEFLSSIQYLYDQYDLREEP